MCSEYKPEFTRKWQIPGGSYYQLSPKMTKYCVVIPVIDEGKNIFLQLRKMQYLGLMKKADVIIADGGSTDGSMKLDVLKAFNVRTLIIKKDIGKLSAQLRMGYAFALNEGYNGIITIDGNNKDIIDSIPLFIEALEIRIGCVCLRRDPAMA